MFSAGAQGKPGGLAAYGGRIVNHLWLGDGTFTDTFFSPYVLVWHGVVFTLFEAFNIGMIGIDLALLQG